MNPNQLPPYQPYISSYQNNKNINTINNNNNTMNINNNNNINPIKNTMASNY